jgi:hypothetical protein
MSDLDEAKAKAERSRRILAQSATALSDRLTPQSLASDAMAVALKGGKAAMIGAAVSAKTRPILAIGMIAAGVGYLIFKPDLTLFANRLNKETNYD